MYALTGNELILYDISNPTSWKKKRIIEEIDSSFTFKVSPD